MSRKKPIQDLFILHRDLAPPGSGPHNFDTLAHEQLEKHYKLTRDRPDFDEYLDVASSKQFRFPWLVCYDDSRYMYPDDSQRKFYHANRLDGYSKADAYLVATAPHTSETCKDFWQMAIMERPLAIVLMDDPPGRQTTFVDQFWPNVGGSINYADNRGTRWLEAVANEVITEAVDRTFTKYRYTLINYQREQTTRAATTVYIMKRDPHGVAAYFPQLRADLAELKRNGGKKRPPKDFLAPRGTIMLVCGDGCRKSCSFVVYDIVMDRAVDSGKVGLKQTVEIARTQRYGAVHTFELYQQLHGVLAAQLADLLAVQDRKKH